MPKITDPTLKAQRVELGKSKRRGDITERVFKNRVKKLEEKQLELNEAEYDRRYKLYQERKRAEAKKKAKPKNVVVKNKISKDLVVDRNYQKQGIGKLLLNKAIEKAKQLNFKKLYLFTFDPSIPLYYEKLGWQKIGTDKFNSHPVTLMEVTL